MKQSVYIFDVDGVLNDMHTPEPDPRIIALIAQLLDNGVFVAINTGRGYVWVEETVVRAIRQQLHSPASISRMFVAAEMGGLGVEFTGSDEQKDRSAFSLTTEQIAQVHQIFDEYPEYNDRIRWYEGKESMATLDKKPGVNIETFRPVQRELTEILRSAFKDQHVKVANSNDAIDVHAPEAGKWAGAQLIYDWLRRATDIQHDHFICFGDSIVDYEMARFFASQGHEVEFVFTGEVLGEIEHANGVKIIQTSHPYSQGTSDFLQQHKELAHNE